MTLTMLKGKKDLASKIDKAKALDGEIKEKQKELKEIKEELKEEAQKNQTHELEGSEFKVVWQDQQETRIDPEKLSEKLEKLGMSNKFYDVVKVKVSDAHKLFGGSVLESITEYTDKPYYKMTWRNK